LQYPVDLLPDGKSYVVTFPDVPEAITHGTSKRDALRHAVDALETALTFYIDDSRHLPTPSKPRRGQSVVELPPSYLAKVLLLKEMKAQKARPALLTRRLHLDPRQVSHLLNPYRISSIDQIAGALRVLGKSMEIRAV